MEGSIKDAVMPMLYQYGPPLLLAVVTLFVGFWVIRVLVKVVNRGLRRSKLEPSVSKFLANLLSILFKVLLLVSVASMVGIETTSFIAVIGAAGLAIGLALQGSLANFAGGVLLLTFTPYKIGDVIEAQGMIAKVTEIQVFNTILKTADNKTIIIPNGILSNGVITNFSTEPTRRVDMTFGIGYTDNIDQAREVLSNIIAADDRILKEPEPMIAVSELADSSVNWVVRVWCNAADYWGIYFDMNARVKKAFDAAGISIPFPQRDVHLYKVLDATAQ